MKHIKIFLVTSFCLLCKTSVFATDTKQMIHNVLAKYGISAGGKKDCNTGKDTDYNEQTGVVKCKNNMPSDDNNCWDKDSRLCKECPNGTIVSKQDHITCRQIVCPEGYELIEIQNNECPDGFEIKEFNENCDDETYVFDEVKATSNYSTQPINCKDIN